MAMNTIGKNDVESINDALALARAIHPSNGITAAARTFTTDARSALADSGAALSDGSYPIPDKGALARAIQSIGRAGAKGTPAYNKVKAHIQRRAQALDAVDMLPADWTSDKKPAFPGAAPPFTKK